MTKNAAQDLGEQPLAEAGYSIIERQHMELPIDGKWPRGWRLLFLIFVGALFWAAILWFFWL